MTFDPSTLNGHHHKPEDPRIFVFGSNVIGVHGGGAAWYAHKKLGARMGVGEGLTGRTYALPTCYHPGEPVTYGELMVYVQNFVDFAKANPQLHFFVSAVGCGIAGFTESEVGPLFKDAPFNCDLPPGWRWPACQRFVSLSPQTKCASTASYIYRYDYQATLDPDGRRRVGCTLLCEKHYEDSEMFHMGNDSDPKWVKL